MVSIAASGNTWGSIDYYPASIPVVMSVGASNHENRRSQYSSYFSTIDLVAPGGFGDFPPSHRDIYSTFGTSDTQYAYDAGTSMAAPHVSGTASLLQGYSQDSLNRTLYNDGIRNIIKLSADKVRTDLYTYDSHGWNEEVGFGRLNARRALDFLRAPYTLV